MPTVDDSPRRDYEETFRALGQLLDDQRLEDVLLVERASGFLVTALRRTGQVPATSPGSQFEYVETVLLDDDITAASDAGIERRGTRHRADRNEEALRLIGRHVNEMGGAHVLVVDHGHGFVLRMLLAAEADMPHRFQTISTGELAHMRAAALAARRVWSGHP